MKNIFTSEFWSLERLKERLRQLGNAFDAANGRLDRKYKLGLSLIFVILLAVVSWVAGSQIQSPAEAAARAASCTGSCDAGATALVGRDVGVEPGSDGRQRGLRDHE